MATSVRIPVPSQYSSDVQSAAGEYGIDPNVLGALLYVESGFNPRVTSGAGAQGIAQFMPGTARDRGVDPWNPSSAIHGAAAYLHELGYSTNPAKALASYNAGPGNPAAGAGYARHVLDIAKSITVGDSRTTASQGTQTPVSATTSTGDTSGGGILAPLFNGAVKGLLWVALILGGATMIGLGISRAAGKEREA